jgi:hypothetical protein
MTRGEILAAQIGCLVGFIAGVLAHILVSGTW